MYESDDQAQHKTVFQENVQSTFNPKIVTESVDIGSGLLKYQTKNYGQSTDAGKTNINGHGGKESELYKPADRQDRPILNNGVPADSFEKNKELFINTTSSNTQKDLRELEEMSSKVDSLLHNSYKEGKKELSVTSPFLQPGTNMRVEDSFQPSEHSKTTSELGSAYAFHSKSEILRDFKLSAAEIYSPEFLVSPIMNPNNLKNQEVIHRSIEINPYLSPSVTPVYTEILREKQLRTVTPEYVSYPKKTSTLYSPALYQDIKEVKQVFQSHNLNKLDQIVESIRKRSQTASVSYVPQPIDRSIETVSIRSPTLDSYDRDRLYTSSTVRLQSPRPEVINFQGDRDYRQIESIRRTNIETDRLTSATVISRSIALDNSKIYPTGTSRILSTHSRAQSHSRVLNSHVPLKLKNDKALAADNQNRMLSSEEQEEGAPQRYAIPDPTVKEKDKTQERGAKYLQSRPIHMSDISTNNKYSGHRVTRSNNFPEQYQYYEEESYQRPPQRVRGDRQQGNRIAQKRDPSFSPPERDEEYIEPVQPVQKPVRANRPYRQAQNREEEQPKAATRKIRPQEYQRVNQKVDASPPFYAQNLVEDDEDSVELEADEVDRVIERDPEPRGPAKGTKPSKVNHQPEVKGGSITNRRRRGQRTGPKPLSNDDGMFVKSRHSSAEKAPRFHSKVGGRGQGRGKGGADRLFDKETELDDFVFE